MRTLRRIIVILYLIISTFSIFLIGESKKVNAQMNLFKQKPLIVDVVQYDSKDKFISLVRQNLEQIQNENQGKVKFNFFDGKGNQSIENEVIDNIARNERVDILLVNLVNTQDTQQVIDVAKKRNIPVIFFNREPAELDRIKNYEKSYYVGSDSKEAGKLQGEILINLWNNDRESIDKNNDGILQYVMLEGNRSNIEAQERTQYAISTINDAGIKTEQTASSISNWQRDLAKEAVNSMILQHGKEIEAIIANNDEMAIGAIEALQKHGYNQGNKAKTIPVVGIDGTEEAQELIKKGEMAGTVVQSPSEMANAIYTIGYNIYQGNDQLYNTQYKADESEVAVRLPYKKDTN